MHFNRIIYSERKAANETIRESDEKLLNFCFCALCEYLMIQNLVYLSLRPLRLTMF